MWHWKRFDTCSFPPPGMKNEHLNFHSGRHYFPDVPSLSFTALSLLFHCILITSSVHCHYFFTALSLLYTAITVSLHYHYCILPLLFHCTIIITISLQAWCHIPPCYILYFHPVKGPFSKENTRNAPFTKHRNCTIIISSQRASRFPSPPLRHIDPGLVSSGPFSMIKPTTPGIPDGPGWH